MRGGANKVSKDEGEAWERYIYKKSELALQSSHTGVDGTPAGHSVPRPSDLGRAWRRSLLSRRYPLLQMRPSSFYTGFWTCCRAVRIILIDLFFINKDACSLKRDSAIRILREVQKFSGEAFFLCTPPQDVIDLEGSSLKDQARSIRPTSSAVDSPLDEWDAHA